MELYTIRNELLTGKSIYDLNLKVTYYTRVSTSKSDQLHSLKSQVGYFEEHIANCSNWSLTDGYIDEGITGTSVSKREAFNQMIEDAKTKKFDLIITKEVSRFARNTLDSLKYTRELLKVGVGVFFQNDNINTLFPDSELRLTIMSSLAQEESRKISDRVKWGHDRSLKAGRVFGNNRIWGYRKDNCKLVIVEEEADIIREIFNLYCKGFGLRKISDSLCEKGYMNQNGNPFNFTSLKYIITNPKYKGYFVGHKSTTVDYLTRQREVFDKSEWLLYKDYESVPPIVSEEVWDKANKVLAQRSEKMCADDKTSYQNKFTYSGKIVCSQHKVSYWRNVFKYDRAKEREIWQCKVYRKQGRKACDNPMIYKDELDSIMKEVINGLNLRKDRLFGLLTSIYEKYLKGNGSIERKLKEVQGQINAVRLRKNKLLDLSLDGVIDNDEFKNRNSEFNSELLLLEGSLEKYNGIKDREKDVSQNIKRMEVFIDGKFNFDVDKNIDPDFLEDFLNEFIDRIEVFKGGDKNTIQLEIFFKAGFKIPLQYIKGRKEDSSLLLISHMIRADIETEIAPLVGTEKQSEELVNYLLREFESDPRKIWESNIFGKSLHELVSEGLHNKLYRMPEDAQLKLQETLQRIINEGSGGLICIIL